jgi:hypothetical protein
MWQSILGFLGGPITSVLETRKIKKTAQAEVLKELARAEVEAKITKVKAEAAIEEKKVQADVDWETIWATQASKSWKDEWFTIILSIPLIGSFVPGLSSHILSGFDTLEQTPEWYQMAVMAAIGAAFGLRALTKFTGWSKPKK